MRIYSLLFILMLLLAPSVYSANPKDDKKKTEADNEQVTELQKPEGVVYALPRTGLVVYVEVQKTTHIPGPYAAYASKYLGYADAMSGEKVEWEISGLKVGTFAEADPDALFKAMGVIASQLSLLGNGIIAGVGVDGVTTENKVMGSAFLTLETKPTVDFTDLSSNDNYNIEVNTETGVETMVFKSEEDKAREAADYLIRLRKKRAYAILDPSDAIPEDGKGYAVFVQEAKRLEKKYVELFIGKDYRSKSHFSFSFIPGNENVKNEVLFRFSKEKGVLPSSDLSGQPILLSLTKDPVLFKEAKQLKNPSNTNVDNMGLFYRIPVSSSIVMNNGMNMLYSGRTVIAQFGVVAPVPDHFIDGQHVIKYNTETGSLKSINAIK